MSSEEVESTLIELIDYEELDNSEEIIQEDETENDETVLVLNANTNEGRPVTISVDSTDNNLKTKNLICNKFGFEEWVYKRVVGKIIF